MFLFNRNEKNAMELSISDKLVETIKRHEGLRLKPYTCTAGKLTIGYGRNLEDVGISEKEAEQLLMNDIRSVENSLFQYPWFTNLSFTRQAIIINMAFNLGIPRLLQFKKMIAALEQHNYPEASYQMLDSKWAKQVGNRAKELSKAMYDGILS